MGTEIYTVGSPRAPAWLENHMRNVRYSSTGSIEQASVETTNGAQIARAGDVLIRLENENRPILLPKSIAKKYSIRRG